MFQVAESAHAHCCRTLVCSLASLSPNLPVCLAVMLFQPYGEHECIFAECQLLPHIACLYRLTLTLHRLCEARTDSAPFYR